MIHWDSFKDYRGRPIGNASYCGLWWLQRSARFKESALIFNRGCYQSKSLSWPVLDVFMLTNCVTTNDDQNCLDEMVYANDYDHTASQNIALKRSYRVQDQGHLTSWPTSSSF